MKISTSLKNLCGARRSTLAAMLLCCPALSSFAVEQNLLTIVFHDGNKQSYVLIDRPKVTFDAKTLYVTGTDISDNYQIGDVDKFVFDKGNPTDIRAVDENELRLSFTDGSTVSLEGVEPGTKVGLYDVAGAKLSTKAASANGRAIVNLADKRPGVYVISVGNSRTFKVTKR